MDEQISDSVATDRFQAVVLTSFGASALFLALLGVYGVLAYSVTLRQREFGIRIALGSGKAALIKLVMRQAVYPILLGAGVGLTVALVVLRWVRRFALWDAADGSSGHRRQLAAVADSRDTRSSAAGQACGFDRSHAGIEDRVED